MNDLDYRASLKDFSSFIETLSEKVIESDDSIPELPMKDVVSLSRIPCLLVPAGLVHKTSRHL